MDNKMNLDSKSSVEQKQRRVIVYPTQRSMSIVKSEKPRHIPHEPIKGAVLSADRKLCHEKTAENVRSHSWLSEKYESPRVSGDGELSCRRSLLPINVTESNRGSELSSVSAAAEKFSNICTASLGTVLPGYCAQHIYTSQAPSSVPVFCTGDISLKTSSIQQHQCQLEPLACLSESHSLQSDNAGLDPRYIDKNLKEDCQRNVPNEVTQLKEEIEVLTKVNSDLKKLLVASIGDDLHFKVDALVRTKVQLANEIGDYTRKLVEDYEDLDKLTIQADLWHSKYQASRVLVDQLTCECDQLRNSLSQAQLVLQYTIQERHELHELLQLARRNLLALVKSHKPSAVENFRTKCPHTLDLAIDIKRLTDTACRTIIGNIPKHESADEDVRQSFTPAELLTHQVLASSRTEVTGNTSTAAARHPPILLPRFHPGAKYEGFTFGCCSRCKGEVIIL